MNEPKSFKDYKTISNFDSALCKLRIFNDNTWTWLDSGESNTSIMARQFRRLNLEN